MKFKIGDKVIMWRLCKNPDQIGGVYLTQTPSRKYVIPIRDKVVMVIKTATGYYQMERADGVPLEGGYSHVDAYDCELIPFDGKIPKGPKKIKSWSL
jgi:hypothetical protein